MPKILNIKNKLPQLPLLGRRVFLRVDANVPLQNGKILDDFRLQAIIPTIEAIRKNGGKIILATHIDRPEKPIPSLSTQNLVPWFEKKGYSIDFEPNLSKAIKKSYSQNNDIILLENLRFFPGEKKQDKKFAKQLARLADFYVNDAFGVSHRNDTSVTLLPALFPSEYRSIGLLMEKELKNLNRLLTNQDDKIDLVLGGGKVSDKIILIKSMLNKAHDIFIYPALAIPFEIAKNHSVGISEYTEKDVKQAQNILNKSLTAKSNLFLAHDYIVAEENIDGSLYQVGANNVPKNAIIITIGQQSIKIFIEKIKEAKIVFFNCAMGFLKRPKTLQATKRILEALTKTEAFTVVAGGDSVAMVHKFNLQNKISYLSTGGGAALTYLSGNILPGLSNFQ